MVTALIISTILSLVSLVPMYYIIRAIVQVRTYSIESFATELKKRNLRSYEIFARSWGHGPAGCDYSILATSRFRSWFFPRVVVFRKRPNKQGFWNTSYLDSLKDQTELELTRQVEKTTQSLSGFTAKRTAIYA